MGWNDPGEILVGSGGGAIYFAPLGTTLPRIDARPDDRLDSAFVGAGYLTEDGAGLSVGSETFDVRGWQSRLALRREKTDQPVAVRFTLLQVNEENLVFAFGGGEVRDNGSGNFTYLAPDETEALDERSLILDAIDGAKRYRYVFPRGNVTEAVETTFQRTGPANLPIGFGVLAPTDGSGRPFYLLTNDPAFAPGS